MTWDIPTTLQKLTSMFTEMSHLFASLTQHLVSQSHVGNQAISVYSQNSPAFSSSINPPLDLSEKEFDELLSSLSDNTDTGKASSGTNFTHCGMIGTQQAAAVPRSDPEQHDLKAFIEKLPTDVQTKVWLVLGSYNYPQSLVDVQTGIRSCAVDLARHALFTSEEIKSSTLRGRTINPLDKTKLNRLKSIVQCLTKFEGDDLTTCWQRICASLAHACKNARK